jgi:hypothetical protein
MSRKMTTVLNVTWHLGYPHRGGFKIELLDQNDKFLSLLTPGTGGSKKDGFIDDDTTQQFFSVTLPDQQCLDCSIRLVRQAAEWGGRYNFWSCSDIDIIENSRNGCGEKGEEKDGICSCEPGAYGDRCQYTEECTTDEDCGGADRGECILPEGTTLPRMARVCYCRMGYFGKDCSKNSLLQERMKSKDGYRMQELNDNLALYWRKVEDKPELEIALRGKTKNYVAVGWRSLNTTKLCKSQFTGLEGLENIGDYAPKGQLHEMDCTDIVVGFAKGSLGRVVDSYTRDRSTPLRDEEYGGTDDLTAALAYEDEETEETVLIFRKPLEATHPTDNSIEDGRMHIIWSHGQLKDSFSHAPLSGLENGSPGIPDFYKEDELKYHGRRNRGLVKLNLLQDEDKDGDSCSFYYPESCETSESGCEYTSTWWKDESNLYISVSSSKLENWFGVGISPDRSMANSFVVLGGMLNGEMVVSEGRLLGYRAPVLTERSDVETSWAQTEDGIQAAKFSIPLTDYATDIVDLSSEDGFHFLFPVSGGGIRDGEGLKIRKHSSTPIVSNKIDLKNCFAKDGKKIFTEPGAPNCIL